MRVSIPSSLGREPESKFEKTSKNAVMHVSIPSSLGMEPESELVGKLNF
jgi:hypothetical protein